MGLTRCYLRTYLFISEGLSYEHMNGPLTGITGPTYDSELYILHSTLASQVPMYLFCRDATACLYNGCCITFSTTSHQLAMKGITSHCVIVLLQ